LDSTFRPELANQALPRAKEIISPELGLSDIRLARLATGYSTSLQVRTNPYVSDNSESGPQLTDG
jgi:hypothetical protein